MKTLRLLQPNFPGAYSKFEAITNTISEEQIKEIERVRKQSSDEDFIRCRLIIDFWVRNLNLRTRQNCSKEVCKIIFNYTQLHEHWDQLRFKKKK